MKNLINEIYAKPLEIFNLRLVKPSETVEKNHVYLLDKLVGGIKFKGEISKKDLENLKNNLAPLFVESSHLRQETNLRVLQWVEELRAKYSDICDWTGIYYKMSFALDDVSTTDLILGPHIGEATDHVRIPIDKGLCGLALKEEQTINIDDVKTDSRYLSCSYKTESEIVIPLKDKQGNFIAELDIDSHSPAAFSKAIEKEMQDYCTSFASIF